MPSPMLAQIRSLPNLLRDIFGDFDKAARQTWDHAFCLSLKRLFVAGCGDSYYAALGGELAFEHLAGLPCEPLTAMQFARYTVPELPKLRPNHVALIGVSVSGQVARTIEAARLGRAAGLTTVALTGAKDTPLAQEAERLLVAVIPPFKFAPGQRSFLASLLGLWLSAIRLGEVRGHLISARANKYRQQLAGPLPDALEATIAACEPLTAQLAADWQDAVEFIFCGSGPGFAAAQFSAAKILEASGDPALGQDLEEWAHTQYFARQPDTPTFLISAGQRDASRVPEICRAAKRIGRRVAAIVPEHRAAELAPGADLILPVQGEIPELFWTLIGAIPGSLFAAHRALLLNEPHFRDFGGGRERSADGGDEAARIRSSVQLEHLTREWLLE